MEVPRLTTVDGAYNYFMGLMLLLALLLAAYVAGVYLGVVPGPSGLYPAGG